MFLVTVAGYVLPHLQKLRYVVRGTLEREFGSCTGGHATRAEDLHGVDSVICLAGFVLPRVQEVANVCGGTVKCSSAFDLNASTAGADNLGYLYSLILFQWLLPSDPKERASLLFSAGECLLGSCPHSRPTYTENVDDFDSIIVIASEVAFRGEESINICIASDQSRFRSSLDAGAACNPGLNN